MLFLIAEQVTSLHTGVASACYGINITVLGSTFLTVLFSGSASV